MSSTISGLRRLFSGEPSYVPATPWQPVPALFVAFLSYAASVALYASLLALIVIAGADEQALGRWSAALGSLASPAGVAFMAATQLVTIAVIWFAAGRSGMRRETLRLAEPKPSWGLCVLAGLLVAAVMSLFELFLYFGIGFDPLADSRWLRQGLDSPYWWGTVLIAVVLAPISEELTFRGFLLSAFAKTWLGFWPAAAISSGLWTALHAGYSYVGLASVFVAGLALSWLMWRTGSMRAVIVAHAVANVAAVLFAHFYPAL